MILSGRERRKFKKGGKIRKIPGRLPENSRR